MPSSASQIMCLSKRLCFLASAAIAVGGGDFVAAVGDAFTAAGTIVDIAVGAMNVIWRI